MAWKTLAEAIESAIAQGMIDCAVSVAADADAEKMAESLDNSPPSKGSDPAEPSPPKRPVLQGGQAIKNKLIGIPDAFAPMRPMGLFLVVDNTGDWDSRWRSPAVPADRSNRRGSTVRETEKGGRQTEGGDSLPTFRSAKASSFNARETKLRVAWDSARAHVAIAVPK